MVLLLSNLTVDEFDNYDIDRLNDTIIQEETTTTDEIQHSKYYFVTNNLDDRLIHQK